MNTKIHLHSYLDDIELRGNYHRLCKINYILKSGKIAFSDVYSNCIANISIYSRIEFFVPANSQSVTNMFNRVVKETI